ncbi:hypothetical protein RN001_010326 [Aquatica leii]|uniref:Cytochrome P450 n=1 Tax=Aquatica leii TaxID=1421715 RepID=A0AAN7Q366_9COLE|nr:hypothetical protein RN001_010326 [Aquatica leii]
MVNATLIKYFMLLTDVIARSNYGVSSHLSVDYYDAYTTNGLKQVISKPPINLDRHYILNLKIRSGVELDSNTFQNQHRLEILNMVLENATLPSGVFSHLSSLKCLTLYATKGLLINKHLFLGLTHLELLQFIKNDTWFPTHVFDILQNLKTLDLSWNNIHDVQKLFQADLNNLHTLRLSGNQLQFLKTSAFTHLRNLKYLVLSYNSISTIQNNAFRILTKLNKLNLRYNHLEAVRTAMFSNLPNLQKLDLQNNNISFVAPNTFAHLNLKTLLLSHNKIPNLRFVIKNLTKLYLHHNDITDVRRDFFENCPNLAILNLSRNKLTRIYHNVFDDLHNLTHLDVSANSIAHLDPNSFSRLINLEYLNLSRNYFDLIESVTFSRNFRLKDLDLSFNRIENLPPGVFASLDELWHLRLNNNRLRSLSPFGFFRLRNLAELDLSDNFIRVINKMAFAGLAYLEKLQLNGNRLDGVDNGVFKGLLYLKLLTLYDNGFDCMDYDVFKHLKMADVILDGVTVILIVIEQCTKKPNLSDLPEPPSPKSLPIIGHLHLLGGYEVPYQAFTNLGKKYGNVIKLKLGSVKSVVINGQESIREVLVSKGHHFDSRPNFERYQQLFGGDKQNSLAFCDWSETQRVRREMLKTYTFPRACTNKFATLEEIITNETSSLVTRVANTSCIKKLVLHSCANIFTNHFCSKDFAFGHKGFAKMIENFDDIFYEVNQGYAADFLPILLPLHQNRLAKMGELAHEIRTFLVDNVIESRYDNYAGDEPGDYVESLIQHVKNEDSSYFNWDCALFALEDIIGGHSAIGNFLVKLLGYLVQNPKVQIEIQKEADALGSKVSISDRTSMPFTEATILEAIRLIASPIVPRAANQDTSINGFRIPKGTLVFLNNYDLSMSEKLWEEPEKFKPERFIVNNHIIKPEHFLPFGGGRRSCMGFRMVQLVSFGILSTLLQNFNILPLENACYKVPIGSLALPKNTFEFKFVRR